MDAIQAAVLSVKLRHLDEWNAIRAFHARTYAQGLWETTVHPPALPPEGESNFHLFVVRTRQRDALRDFLRERGIETGVHYPIANHLQPAMAGRGAPPVLPEAEAIAKTTVSLPMFPALSEEDVETVIAAVQAFFGSSGSSGF